jgi:hypothetical protein
MPRYGEFKYGKIHKYGKYNLSSGGNNSGGMTLGPYTRYRIRLRDSNGVMSDFLTMYEERLSIPAGSKVDIRMRADNGEWVRTQHYDVSGEMNGVRIRSIDSHGNTSEWVAGAKGNLQ